jgi:hypothetical protein
LDFQDESSKKLRLIGYQSLNDHGLALPIFGADRNPNTHYYALCWPPGDVYGSIKGFSELSTENVIPLADDRIQEVTIGSPWLSVFLWDNQIFVGRAEEIWKNTSSYRNLISRDAPLMHLALAEFDPSGNSEYGASIAARRWLETRIGYVAADRWYADSYLRGTMIRLLHAHLPLDKATAGLFDEILYKIRIKMRLNQVHFDLSSVDFSFRTFDFGKIVDDQEKNWLRSFSQNEV